MHSKPLLSIVIPTLNSGALIPGFLDSLSRQTIPKQQLEILIMDGGSTDKTTELAASWGATVVPNPDVLAEPGVNRGLRVATGTLVMILAVDNIFAQPDALENIIRVFDDPSIYAAFPKHESDESDTLYTRYYNTFTDPFNHFVYGYASNARTFHRAYRTLFHSEKFDIYDFTSNSTRPMLALAQGFTLRAGFTRSSADAYDDCKPLLEIINSNMRVAYIHSVPLYHHTIRDLRHFIRKQRWATGNSLRNERFGIRHRESVLSRGQQTRIRLWPVYAFSIVVPLARSIWGVFRDRDAIWLLHPILVFLSAYSSSIETFAYVIDRHSRVSRL